MAGQNTPVLAIDYNNLQSLVSRILGTGSASSNGIDGDESSDYGYGQAVSSSPVLPNSIITANAWNNLRLDIIKCRQHQTGINSLILPVTNLSIITEGSSSPSLLTRAKLAEELAIADLPTNRLIIPPDGSAPETTPQGVRVDLIPAQQRNTVWNNSISQTVTVSFPNANAARYFFNSGSQIELSAGRSGGTNSGSIGDKNNSWTALLNAVGTIEFSAHATNKFINQNRTKQNSIGWYEVGTTDREIFQQTDPTIGTSFIENKYIIKVKTNSQRTQLIFTIEFKDDSSGQEDANIDGILTSRVRMYYSTGSNVAVIPPTATSTSLSLGGTPIFPTYTITVNKTEINSGETITYGLTTTNVKSGTVLYWENIGTTAGSYFTDDTNSGTVTVNLSNFVSFTRQVKQNILVDPNSTIVIKISTSPGGTAVATANSVLIRPSTFAITPNITTVIKGNSVSFNIVTTNFGSGTLYWSTTGSVTTANFTDSSIQGTISVVNNAATLVRTVAADFLEENDKSFAIALKLGSQSGTLVKTSANVTIKSQTYQITHNVPYNSSLLASPILEGNSALFTVNTSNVPNGTILYWTTTGPLGTLEVSASDFTDNALTGSVTINNNTGTIIRGVAVDISTQPWYATTYPTPSWGTFMNTYAVWKDTQFVVGTKTGSFIINFPQTGTYTIEYSSDDESSWNLVSSTGVTVSSASTGNNQTTFASKAVTINSAGNYTFNMSVTNSGPGTNGPGNPGGIAIRIVRPLPSNLANVAVSVIDEASTPTAQQLINDWSSFRTNFPNRKFCLLWPQGSNSLSDLKIPSAFNTNPNKVFSNVNRDNGNAGSRSDWFAICGLGSLPAGSSVYLSVDNSGSMTTSTVQASYDYFKTRVAQAGLVLYEQPMPSENWIAPLNVPDELTNTRIFAVQVPTESDEKFNLELRAGSISGTILKTSSPTILIQEQPQIKVLSITNMYTSWGPDAAGGYHAITFDWTAGYVNSQGVNVVTDSGHVSNDIHLSPVINQYGYNGSYATSLIGKLISDPAVASYLFVGNQGNGINQASPMDSQGRWPNTTRIKLYP